MYATNFLSDIEVLQCHPSEMDSTQYSYFADVASTNAPSEVILNTNISKGIEKILSESFSKEVMDKMNAKYPQPSNCSRLSVLGCYPEVFRNVGARACFRNLSMQAAQRSLIFGITVVAFVFEAIMQQSKNGDFKEKLSDGTASPSNASLCRLPAIVQRRD